MNASSGLSVSPNYTTSLITPDNSTKNLKNEQEAISSQNIPSAQDVQSTNQINFAGTTTSSYVPISSAPHMYPTQPTVTFTSGKYIDLFLNCYI